MGWRITFFVCHAKLAKRLPDCFLADPKSSRALILIIVRTIQHVFGQLVWIKLAYFLAIVRFWRNALGPTLERGDPDAKTLGSFLKGQSFFLSNGKHMLAKRYRIGHTTIIS